MKLLAYLLAALVFIGPVILAHIGWPVDGDMSKKYYYPSVYILILYITFASISNIINVKKNKYSLSIIVLIIIVYTYCKLFGRFINGKLLFECMALPAMYFTFFMSNPILKHKDKIRNIVIALYIINCLFAIYERIIHTQFFPPNDIYGYQYTGVKNVLSFRSTALLGHPLSNALIMSIIMVFILTSNIKSKNKGLLYSIGFIGIFCFNARAAIIINFLTVLLYLLRPMFSRRKSLKNKITSIIILITLIIFSIFLFNLGFAGRFEERGAFNSDSSFLARLDVWGVWSVMNYSDILFGMSSENIQVIATSVVGMNHIENWFILSTMNVGIILTTIVVILFIPLFRKSLEKYDKFTSILIVIVVIGLGSTNNSLACGVPALVTFFLCSCAFWNMQQDVSRT